MLQLEYVVTDAERREAKSLDLRRQFGKGSRTRTLLTLFAILAALLTLAYFQIRTIVPPKYQPLCLASAAALFFFFYYQQVRRKQAGKPAKTEITEREITIVTEAGRYTISWSGFSQCMESPNLFVLLDRPKGIILIFPKRAFPDEKSQNWFRILANQPSSPSPSTVETQFSPNAPPATNSVTLDFQLGYRDFLNWTLTSWRTRGIVLMIYLTMFGMFVYELAHPSPVAVNSPAKVFFLFMLPIVTAMLALVLPIVSLVQWRTWAKYSGPRRLMLSHEHIGFAGNHGSGIIPWTAYQCYLENPWSFFVWHTKNKLWDILPKRAFTSAVELDRCRALLQNKLRRSRWFFH